jgi:isocitrate dehydrogenase (NAD+)
MTHRITLIPGDGIGPEVVAATRRVIEAAGVRVDWDEQCAGAECHVRTGEALPEATIESIRRNRVALKGPTATPSGGGFRSVNVLLRQKLDLFANYRPAKSVPGTGNRFDDVDLIVIRENTEGLYSGIEHEVVPGVVESLRVVTEKASRRVVRFAFDTARRLGRKKVTAVHKANILKMSDGLFLKIAREVAEQNKDIAFDDCIVDACAMKLVIKPQQFDVLVMENLFGDIISDLCAGLVGGLGLTASGNIGSELAVFEAVHGSAPDIAGRGLANPTALIRSGCLMLEHLGELDAARRIEEAIRAVILQRRTVTGDLGGKATTGEFTDAVIARLRS